MDFHTLLTVTHDFGRGIQLGSYTLRIYQLMFLASFVCGFYMVKYMFRKEGAPEKWLDSLLVYLVVSTIIGARLGHVFFYQWDYYKDNIGEIFMVWQGGLASHGAAVAIIIGLWIFSRKVSKTTQCYGCSIVWLLLLHLAGAFIRTGELYQFGNLR